MKNIHPQNSAAEMPDHLLRSQEQSFAIPDRETRSSDSPFVEQIGRLCAEREYAPLCSADGHWNMLLVRYHGETSASVWGPMTKVATMPYREGAEFLYITFTLGTFLPQMPAGHLLDTGAFLPRASATSFWLGDASWQFPDYEHIETFVSKLVRKVSVRLTELLLEGLRGEAVELYQMDVVGIPAELVVQSRHAPFRPALETIAPTLVYDATILGNMEVLAEQLGSISVPTLLISGEASPTMLGNAAQAVTDALPHAQHRRLPGQTHDIEPSVLAPVLETFLLD